MLVIFSMFFLLSSADFFSQINFSKFFHEYFQSVKRIANVISRRHTPHSPSTASAALSVLRGESSLFTVALVVCGDFGLGPRFIIKYLCSVSFLNLQSS